MTLSSLCQRDILTLSAETSVQKAAELMRTQHVGAMALTDPENPVRVVGEVTDRDLVVNLLAQGRTAGRAVNGRLQQHAPGTDAWLGHGARSHPGHAPPRRVAGVRHSAR